MKLLESKKGKSYLSSKLKLLKELTNTKNRSRFN